MNNQLNENLTEIETTHTPLTIEQRLMDLYRDNKRTYVNANVDVIYLEVLNIPTVITLSCLKQKSQIISSCY